ncbi:hypothetical protein [Halarcobacter anaerophilus]|uniref:Uncharacterized protein n=1 Tax=Halarcobacter anaerophilus TaxID=877500 RepID=A0A4Q0XYW1_9BACT|nr:hypothetical protein [Halarcobacter anaerophilus]QDF29915.1 hypothetical protein AANAER_2459 [Halarcobacter anaerophilus]RXJ62877.1 hypothetical protein CRV06_08565 [Halarcobacter anaerophilus]
MTFKETMAKLFSTSEGTYYKWKKEDRPIIKLLDKYLAKEDLEEFFETGEILKFELLYDLDMMHAEICKKIRKQIGKYVKNFSSTDVDMCFNSIDALLTKRGKEVTQLEMIKLLVDKNDDNFLNIKDEIIRCAYISSLSILSELEFKILKRELYCIL